MNKFTKLLNSFDYKFPQELIAQSPSSPRDSAKLLIYTRANGSKEQAKQQAKQQGKPQNKQSKIIHDSFKNILDYLPKNSVLVFNQTKVIPARLKVIKPTGGHAQILYIATQNNYLKFLSDKKLVIGSKLLIDESKPAGPSFVVLDKQNQFYLLKPSFKISSLFAVLNKYGQTPLPPYIKHSPLKGKKLLTQYNTVFAKTLGSVAAPTASLHFTKSLLNKIKKSGIKIVYVTLHVNLGTFAPLTEQQFNSKKLHTEYYEISKSSADILNKAKKSGKSIIAVGTTVVRTLESAASKKRVAQLIKLNGSTDLFLTETSKLNFVDCLITNFHVPKSSLLMLVSAFTGRTELLKLYRLAIKKNYKLFSFGDGMLIK